jgi:hypothetical protein
MRLFCNDGEQLGNNGLAEHLGGDRRLAASAGTAILQGLNGHLVGLRHEVTGAARWPFLPPGLRLLALR